MGFWNWLNGTPSPEELGDVYLKARQAGDKEFFLGSGNVVDAHVDRYEGGYHIFTDEAGSPQIIPVELEKKWRYESDDFDPEDVPHYSPREQSGNWFTRLFS